MKITVNFRPSYLAQAAIAGSVTVLLASCGGGNGAAPAASEPGTRLLAGSLAGGYNSSLVAADLYVASTGSDSNPGTQAAPLLTIAKAAQLAMPGVTVHVAPGSYAGGFSTATSGTASARIRYVSDTKWGARIVPPAGSTSATAWDNRGSHVDIVGFEVDGSAMQGGTAWRTGLYNAGTDDVIANNHVHHLGMGGCGSGGGIGIDSYYQATGGDVRANVVHHIGPSGCSLMYGVYVSTPDSSVQNNLIYGVANAAIQLWHDATRVKVVNNTVFGSAIGVLVGSGAPYQGTASNDNTRVSNNVLYDNQYGLVEQGAVGAHNIYTSNLVFQDAMYDFLLNSGSVATATVKAAPQFVNYQRAGGGDYHLSAASPAVDKGDAAGAPTTDLDGAARPSGAGFDIGAYEFASPNPSPSPGGGSGGGSAPGPVTDPVPNTSYHLYVATTGSDGNPGTQSLPLRTIARAAALARASTTVHVAAGTYAGGFKTTASGTAGGRIYYVSSSKWGAKIVPPAGSSNDTAWDNRGSYVDINGFEIDGSVSQGGTVWLHGIYNGGSYDAIRNNHVHHIATTAGCTGAGGSAIGVDSYYHGVFSDVINNVVHDIGPAGCRYIQGIYMSTSGSVQSNVVYRVAEAAIHLWHDATNVVIANNTVSNSDTGIIVGGGDFYYSAGPDDNTHVVNNIVYDNRYGISEQGSTGTHNTYSNNLVFQNSTYNVSLRNGLQAGATVSADPQFAGYSRSGTPDFHLRSSSPAVAKGSSSYAPQLDIEGYARTPAGIGAYQYH